MLACLYDEATSRLRDPMTGRFVAFDSARVRMPDETCPLGCERYGDRWVPADCPTHLGGAS